MAQMQAGVHELSPDQQELRRSMMGYNFTERVRKVLAIAREEAVRLRHEYVAPEHILLGLIGEGEGVASTLLQNLGVGLDDIRQKLEESVKKGKAHSTGPDLPYTSHAKKVLELSMSEARSLNHSYVGTEHLLMGLLLDEQSLAAKALSESGVTPERARAEVVRILGENLSEAVSNQRRGEDSVVPFLSGAPERLRRVFASAYTIAGTLGAPELTPVHVVLALLQHRDGAGNAALDLLRVNRDAVIESLQQIASRDKGTEVAPEATLKASNDVQGLMGFVIEEQRALGSPAPGTQHLLLALLRGRSIANVFAEHRLPVDKIREEVRRISG
jgi:ATP-dependent Clp protease ATP-binding subunit ClpA